jgi:hypothetical protein
MAAGNFDATEILRRARFPGVAQRVLFREGRSIQLSNGLNFSAVEAIPDEYCPHGIIGMGCAVDTDEERAARRATLEAFERYCLSASGYHNGAASACGAIAMRSKHRPNTTKTACAAQVFMPYRGKQCIHSGTAITSNGVAVGCSLEDAFDRAALELLERDAVMRFWYTPDRYESAALPAASDTEACAEAVNYLDIGGYNVVSFCMPSLGETRTIIAFAISRRHAFPYSACAASATSTNLLPAHRAALLELVQTMVALGLRGDEVRKWAASPRIQCLDHHMYYYGVPRLGMAPMDDILKLHSSRMDGRRWCRDSMQPSGEFSFVDLTPGPLGDEIGCARAFNSTLRPLVIAEELTIGKINDQLYPYPHPFP